MSTPPSPRVPWPGFWLGGFDGADHVTAAGQALDVVRASGHLDRLDEDFRRARQAGLCAVRESIGWRLSERADGTIELDRMLHVAHAARRHGLRVLWTLAHYGLPPSLNLHDDSLIPRFARFAGTVARALRAQDGPGQVYTPIYEIGYLAWAASQSGLLAPPNGLAPGHAGTSLVCGYAVKRRLVRAALAGIAAIRDEDPQARFLHCEPLLHVVAPPDRPDLAPDAEVVRSWQWQPWDLLSGRAEPELGGSPEALDLLGLHLHPSGQWELLTERRLPWHLHDPRRVAFGAQIEEAFRRYGRPVLVTATGQTGSSRADWLHGIAAEAQAARARGVEVAGLAVYPLVDRPEWSGSDGWQRAGLWHVETASGRRYVEPGLRDALGAWRRELPLPARRRSTLVVALSRRWDALPEVEQPALRALAAHWHVIAVEPALHEGVSQRLEVRGVAPGLHVVQPHLPASVRRLRDAATLMAPLLLEWCVERGLVVTRLWPVGDTARRLAPSLAAELGAQPVALPLPRATIELRAHRQAAGQRGGWAAEQITGLTGDLRGPRVGCLDVGDGARFHLGRIIELADTLPRLQIVLAGAAFLDQPSLRRRPNVRCVPAPSAALLPALLASWSVGLRPLERAGSGTGLLLQLASGRPLVASGAWEGGERMRPLGLLADDDGHAVVSAVRAALDETRAQGRRRRRRLQPLLRACDASLVAARWLQLLTDHSAPLPAGRERVLDTA